MVSGRKTVFTIYDEEKYLKLKQYLLRTNQDGSHFIWNLIENELKRIDELESINSNQSTIASFVQVIPPPRIIEDFEHMIRPYLNKSTEEEIKLVNVNGYRSYIYTSYFIEAEKMNMLTHEERKEREISYDRALRGLENLRSLPSYGVHFTRGNKQ